MLLYTSRESHSASVLRTWLWLNSNELIFFVCLAEGFSRQDSVQGMSWLLLIALVQVCSKRGWQVEQKAMKAAAWQGKQPGRKGLSCSKVVGTQL